MTTPHSSSSSSSPSPVQSKRTMEEVWKDISLNNLQQDPHEQGRQRDREMILQNFLATPDNRKDTQPTKRFNNNLSLFDSPASSTVLSLSSGSDLQYADWFGFQTKNHNPAPFQGNQVLRDHRETLASFAGGWPDSCAGEKLADRRHKRMIKNRESAARSRARKQAYTNELEHEVAQLLEENAKLRKQLEQQQQNSANHSAMQVPQAKHTLWRTLTSPF